MSTNFKAIANSSVINTHVVDHLVENNETSKGKFFVCLKYLFNIVYNLEIQLPFTDTPKYIQTSSNSDNSPKTDPVKRKLDFETNFGSKRF